MYNAASTALTAFAMASSWGLRAGCMLVPKGVSLQMQLTASHIATR